MNGGFVPHSGHPGRENSARWTNGWFGDAALRRGRSPPRPAKGRSRPRPDKPFGLVPRCLRGTEEVRETEHYATPCILFCVSKDVYCGAEIVMPTSSATFSTIPRSGSDGSGQAVCPCAANDGNAGCGGSILD